jgi:predicted SAM-dependent methyltransferase
LTEWYDWNQWWFDVGKYGRNRPWLSKDKEQDFNYRKANVGCGTLAFKPENGWYNLDQFPDYERGVMSFNLCSFPYDFPDDYFDYMFFSNVLEHIPDSIPNVEGEAWYNMLEELLRITKPGGIWEIHGPDPRDAVDTLQVGGHTRLVGPHTFEHLTIRYKHGAMRTTHLHDNFGAEWVDMGKYSRFKFGIITDWHLRRYLGRRLGDIAAKIIGKPGQIRMVLRIVKGARE